MIVAFNLVLLTAMALVAAAFIAYAWGADHRWRSDSAAMTFLPRWLRVWTLKGLVVPLLIWAVVNLGWPGGWGPLLPQVQLARGGGGPWPWSSVFLYVCLAGLFPIASYWSALTVGWIMMGRIPREPEQRRYFRNVALLGTLIMALPVLVVLWWGGWMNLGLAVCALLLPLVICTPAQDQPAKLPPMYARAIARIKFGKYAEAEQEILGELEKHKDDFEGWLMLAELYAVQFKDLPEAETTTLEICDQPEVTPSQVAVALHKLADWQLQVAGDPVAARRALQRIVAQLPGTHLAHMARLRSNSLPRSAVDWRELKENRPVPLPALSRSRDESTAPPPIPSEQAVAQVNQLTARLRENPDDIVLRERLARLLAESLGKVDLGMEQLWLLVGSATAPPGKRPEWLALIAAWELRLRHDRNAARKLLERIVTEHPDSVPAFAARQRLEELAEEERRWAPDPPAG